MPSRGRVRKYTADTAASLLRRRAVEALACGRTSLGSRRPLSGLASLRRHRQATRIPGFGVVPSRQTARDAEMRRLQSAIPTTALTSTRSTRHRGAPAVPGKDGPCEIHRQVRAVAAPLRSCCGASSSRGDNPRYGVARAYPLTRASGARRARDHRVEKPVRLHRVREVRRMPSDRKMAPQGTFSDRENQGRSATVLADRFPMIVDVRRRRQARRSHPLPASGFETAELLSSPVAGFVQRGAILRSAAASVAISPRQGMRRTPGRRRFALCAARIFNLEVVQSGLGEAISDFAGNSPAPCARRRALRAPTWGTHGGAGRRAG